MRTKPTLSEGEPREAGPHGVTRQMIAVGRTKPVVEREPRDRDRTLAGKARRIARRAAS